MTSSERFARHRLTAAYVSDLMRYAYQAPHLILRDLVDEIAGYSIEPEDVDNDEASTKSYGGVTQHYPLKKLIPPALKGMQYPVYNHHYSRPVQTNSLRPHCTT
jgi:hypothetical protein